MKFLLGCLIVVMLVGCGDDVQKPPKVSDTKAPKNHDGEVVTTAKYLEQYCTGNNNADNDPNCIEMRKQKTIDSLYKPMPAGW